MKFHHFQMHSPALLLPVALLLIHPLALKAAPGDADNDGLRDEVETNTGIFLCQ
jgi:hypothetical protein